MSNLVAQSADLLAVTTTTYDQTKTNLLGNVAQRTILGNVGLSTCPVQFMDVFTDTGGDVPYAGHMTDTGKVYFMTAPVAGLARIILYNLNLSTGAYSYVGKLAVTLPNLAATTHVLHGIEVDESNPADIHVMWVTTGSVLINGGCFVTHQLSVADFVPSGFATLPMATAGTNQKAVYLLQDPANCGAGQLNTASAAVSMNDAALQALVHNGVSATHQYYIYNYSATLTIPAISCTTPIATPGVVNATSHGFNAGDQVQFAVTGGALPTGLVAGTTYFVIAAGLGASVFEVSATSGGAAINFTGTSTGTQTVFRSFGICTTGFALKTGNLPALAGVLLTTCSEEDATPLHTTNLGFLCIFFATTTNLYMGRMSDLTSGVTTWPTLVTANLLGAGTVSTTPTASAAYWSSVFDRAIFITNTTKFIAKKMINNLVEAEFGVLNRDYLEGVVGIGVTKLTGFGLVTNTNFAIKAGWLVLVGSTVGQRGGLILNTGADAVLDSTMIISKVITLSELSLLSQAYVSSCQIDEATPCQVFYRTSGFGTAAGGWIALPDSLLFPASTYATQIQLKLKFEMTYEYTNNPQLICEMGVISTPINAVSPNWAPDNDNTTQGLGSPSYVSFVLKSAYPVSVPTLYDKVYDTSANLIFSANSVTNAGSYNYSTDGGTTWLALGTIPNTVGTRVRISVTPVPGGLSYASRRES